METQLGAGVIGIRSPEASFERGGEMGANADTIQTLWEAFGRRDIEEATSGVADDAEIVVPKTLPWGGTYRGPDGFKEMIGKVLGIFEEFSPQPQAFLEADDDHVVVPITVSARTAAGTEISGGRGLWLYKLNGGKVTRAEVFPDTAAIRDALS
jgi:ketosteroid isomerase-like protein